MSRGELLEGLSGLDWEGILCKASIFEVFLLRRVPGDWGLLWLESDTCCLEFALSGLFLTGMLAD